MIQRDCFLQHFEDVCVLCGTLSAVDSVGGGVGRDLVRAHVGVRVGAGGRRARHAPVRRRGAAGLHRGLTRHLPRHQLRAPLRAARRLPAHLLAHTHIVTYYLD